jgi:hypothetical protein
MIYRTHLPVQLATLDGAPETANQFTSSHYDITYLQNHFYTEQSSEGAI